jgi:hypothetical protein
VLVECGAALKGGGGERMAKHKQKEGKSEGRFGAKRGSSVCPRACVCRSPSTSFSWNGALWGLQMLVLVLIGYA